MKPSREHLDMARNGAGLNGTATKRRKPVDVDAGNRGPRLANYEDVKRAGDDDEEEVVRTGLSAATILRQLHDYTDGWPRRVNDRLFVLGSDYRPEYLSNQDAFFAWIGRVLGKGHNGNPLRWTKGTDRLSRGEFFQHCLQTAERYAALACFPHWPLIPGHLYHHPALQGCDGRAARGLLERFSPATPHDHDLLWACLLTLVWGGAPGQRPAFLFDADDADPLGGRGVGKTKTAQMLARLVGGHVDVRPNEDFDKLATRLLSESALDRRIVLLDNIRQAKFSWADLEALITSDMLSGRQLYVGEGRRPNTIVWMLTVNRASLTRDLAQRCVIIRLARPERNPAWESDTIHYIEKHRWAILGDCVAQLKKRVARLENYSRWSAWEQEVLAHVAEPAAAQDIIADRQGEVDNDDDEAALIRQALREDLAGRGHNPDTEAVFIPSRELARLADETLNERRSVNRAIAAVNALGLSELRKSAWKNGSRGFCWRGPKCPAGATMSMQQDRPMPVSGGYNFN